MTVLSAMTSDIDAIDASTLAKLVLKADPLKKTIIVDCRSFIDYNVLHIRHAINAFYSKMMRRRVYDNKVCSSVMLSQIGEQNCGSTLVDLVLYSESEDTAKPANSYSAILTRMKRKCNSNANTVDDSPQKLLRTLQEKFTSANRFHKVLVLKDGFDDFHSRFPELCESSKEQREDVEKSVVENHIRTSVSHPCLSSTSDGPTQILPFLYLGSQQDAMDSGVLLRYGIKYVINLSVNCPQPDALPQEGHFMRIPVNDTYQEKLLPHFEEAFRFLDEVCERGSVALVHCLAGISRSPTLAIAYMMRRNKWTSEQAYRYVKERRPSISPNFNFMGQLLEYETRLREQHGLSLAPEATDNNTALSPASFTLSTVSSSDSPDDMQQIKETGNDHTSKLGKSISCEALSGRVSYRPYSFWESDCSEPSSKTNENGKRAMEIASPHSLDRPRILDGLKSRKALNIPQKVDEDLPSPSTELQKLSFGHSPDTSNSASNPFFSTSTSVEKPSSPSVDPTIPSTSTEKHYSAENPTFSSGDHSPIALTLPSNTVHRNGHRTAGHKLLTRLSHCLRKGSCGLEHNNRNISSVPTTACGEKPMAAAVPAVASSSSSSANVPPAVIRSQSVNASDETQKRAASFVCSRGAEQQQEHSHFIADADTTTADSVQESSASFPEADRDSISSASSLEILVQ